LRLRFLNKKKAKAAIAVAATPSPAPRPAARPVLLPFGLVTTAPVGDEVPEAWLVAVPPVLVIDVVIMLDIMFEDARLAVEAPVF
jgi:hypothetical protein